MTVLEKIKNLLDQANVEYKELEHDPVYTSKDAAEIRDEDVSNGAKALVLIGDKSPVLTVVPGDKKVDFKKVKSYLEIDDLRMATPEEVKEITTLEIGAIPPVGKALGLSSYFDNSFLLKDKVAFNAGDHCTSIIMSAEDLIKVEQPEIFNLSR